MEGRLILKRNGYTVEVGDDFVKIEERNRGFSLVPSRTVATFWKPAKGVKREILEKTSFDGAGEAFTIQRGGWKLCLYRWNTPLFFAVELFYNALFIASLVWENDVCFAFHIEGNIEQFSVFVEEFFTEPFE